jgi:ankyrin repeat protein
MVIRRKHLAGVALSSLVLGGVMMALIAGIGTPGLRDRRIADAAEKQDMGRVRTLLERGVDANSAQPDGATALHWAVHWNDIATAEVLIGEGANVNAVNRAGASPLALACSNGNATMVQALLDARANVNVTTPAGETPLMRCARSGRADAVKTLLAHGAHVNAADKEHGQTALMWAVAEKHPEAVQALIEGDADIRLRSKDGFDALMLAARTGHMMSAELLIGSGADTNERGPQGMTPLLLAALSGQQEMGALLLAKGADANARDEYGATALHYAMTRGISVLDGVRYSDNVSELFRPTELSLIEALLRHGANPNVRLEKAPPLAGPGTSATVGATPFLLAAASHETTVMRMLVDAGADPKIPTAAGLTPLMAAAGAAQVRDLTDEEKQLALDTVMFALELGADVGAMNETGLTALHAAAANGDDAVVQFLIAKGAKIDVRDKYQQTPLSIAAGERLPWVPEGEQLGEIIQPSTRDLLLKLGATPLDTPGYFTPPPSDAPSEPYQQVSDPQPQH